MKLILDKCYLVGASAEEIKKLLSEHNVFMSETLFLEVLTADNESHINKCFRKLPQAENPITLLKPASSLMFFERKNHKPCGLIENFIYDVRYEFNSDLRTNQYNLVVKHSETPIKEWKKKTSDSACGFLQKASTVCGWFPELKGKERITEEEKDLAIQKTAENFEFIKNVYAGIHSEIRKKNNEEWPSPEKINKNRALFRYFQFHIMGTLELFWRQSQDDKKVKNAYLDMDYCILGAFADGIVTRDKAMIKFFEMACPEKTILN